MTRRTFVQNLALALLAVSARLRASGDPARPPRLLLRSSWQTYNIGDIAHTPGVLALIERHIPGVELWLYPKSVDRGVRELLLARFPKLRIIGPDEEKIAYEACDFFLHGSGPSLVGEGEMTRWHETTGKPFGIYGVTFDKHSIGKKFRATLDAASFFYLRDSVSLKVVRTLDLKTPVIEWAPDGAFACDLHDDKKAAAFLAANALEDGKFLCCISRFRYTPYWLTDKKGAVFSQQKHDRNEAMKENDHAPLRDAIIAVVRGSDFKILLCPEDSTQMAVAREMILEKLPEDVRKRVVWRENYWLTDEALSTYVRSAGVFGLEMHSPIMCIGHGIPAIVCRSAEQTSKGFMWRDIGLDDWLFDFDKKSDHAKLTPAVLSLIRDPAAARAKAAAAREIVLRRQRETLGAIAGRLGVAPASVGA